MKVSARRMRVMSAVTVLALGSILGYVAVQAAPRTKVIKISAKRFDYAPGRVTLKKGEPVILELTSRDVLMGFNLPDFNLRADVIPEKVTRVTFVPDKSGTFTFLCDVFCGSKHEEMHGTLTVVD